MTTWTFDADSKIIRFYLWLWAADPANIDFCRLFWGYVFCWVALLIKPVAAFTAWLERRASNKPVPTLDERLKAIELRDQKKKVKAQKWENSRLNRLLSRLERFGTRHGALLSKLFRFTLFVVGSTCALALLGLIVLIVVQNPLAVLIAIGILAGVGLVAGAITWVFSRTTAGKRVDIAANKAWNGTKFFGRFLKEGERNVKNRTCPKIVILDATDRKEAVA